MNHVGCERARELIPLWVAEAVSEADARGVERHLDGCVECRAEAELVRALFESRPQAPAGLPEHVEATIRFETRAVRRPWWGLAAAAVAVLAVGIGVMSQQSTVPGAVPVYASEASESELWLTDDGLVAGAASLEDLSDEALEQLLSELAMGGAA